LCPSHITPAHPQLNLRLVKRLLEKHGFDVDTAADGRDALDKLIASASASASAPASATASASASAPLCLCLMDLEMPHLSGSQATRAFRDWELAHASPGTPRLPIIAFTANVLEETREECDEAGMDGFCSKPLRADVIGELEARARAYSAQKMQQRSSSGGGADDAI
jgi:CheY-like chemotaxis protein